MRTDEIKALHQEIESLIDRVIELERQEQQSVWERINMKQTATPKYEYQTTSSVAKWNAATRTWDAYKVPPTYALHLHNYKTSRTIYARYFTNQNGIHGLRLYDKTNENEEIFLDKRDMKALAELIGLILEATE